MHSSQPTLSRQIADRKQDLGVKLVVHGRKVVTLTDSGLLFQQRAKEMGELPRRQNGLQNFAELSLLPGREYCFTLLPKAMRQFSKEYPDVTYQLYSVAGDEIREKIDRGSVDLGILLEPH